MSLYFADLSAWNSADLSKYPGQVVILRAAGETAKDTKLDVYRSVARKRGLVRGLYGFLPASGDMLRHAQMFAKAVGRVEPNEFLICDIETGSARTSRALTWCKEVERILKRSVMIYATLSDVTTRAVDMRMLAPRRLWVAAWRNTKPAFPHTIWQYTNEHSAVWSHGRVDMNRYDGTLDQFRQAVLLPPTVPTAKTISPVPINVSSRTGAATSSPLIPRAVSVVNARVVPATQCPILHVGSTDNGPGTGWVRYLQFKLGTSPNGYFGNDERNAVAALQRRAHYQITGTCDYRVWHSLGQP